MPAVSELTLRGLKRSCVLLGGALADRWAQRCFTWRHPPRRLLHAEPRVSADTLDKAIDHGARFLLRHQGSDGTLRGFYLYPGASTSWMTAHVCFVVEGVHALDELARRAARNLHASGADDGGWGYNRRVAVDCDSWAQALMALQRFARPVPDFLLHNLAAAQSSCGGYPTYPPVTNKPARDGWQTAHAEVSAMVVECLRRAGGHEQSVARGMAWLHTVSRDGVLPSYWWSDDAYALWLQARTGLLDARAAAAVQGLFDGGQACPQLPMALTAALALHGFESQVHSGTQRLLAMQFADGSWPCGPCLRVTHPSYRGLGRAAAGVVMADRRRVFSTAHAVAALQCVRQRLSAST